VKAGLPAAVALALACVAAALACGCALHQGYGSENPGQTSPEHPGESEEASGVNSSGHHVHEEGERSECTDWLFTQPWASPAQWRRIAGDSLLLLGFAAVVGTVSRIPRK
jgi:hypothetical protein